VIPNLERIDGFRNKTRCDSPGAIPNHLELIDELAVERVGLGRPAVAERRLARVDLRVV